MLCWPGTVITEIFLFLFSFPPLLACLFVVVVVVRPSFLPRTTNTLGFCGLRSPNCYSLSIYTILHTYLDIAWEHLKAVLGRHQLSVRRQVGQQPTAEKGQQQQGQVWAEQRGNVPGFFKCGIFNREVQVCLRTMY